MKEIAEVRRGPLLPMTSQVHCGRSSSTINQAIGSTHLERSRSPYGTSGI